jgi:Delta7-sterol 5-desaturase
MATVTIFATSLMLSWYMDDEPLNMPSNNTEKFHWWRFIVSDSSSAPLQVFMENYVTWLSIFGFAYCLFYSSYGKKWFRSFKFYPGLFPDIQLLVCEFLRSARGVFIASMYEIILANYYNSKVLPLFKNTSIGVLNKQSFQLSIQELVMVLIFQSFVGEAHFFWTHRLMHESKWLYRNVHKVHHESIHPDPWSGLSMHPFESAVYFSVGPLLALFCPFWMAKAALKSLIIFPLEGHLGHQR